MPSILKIISNRANAALSTGPKTVAGKARSAQNAVKHGLSARVFTIAPALLPEFERLRIELHDSIQPTGALEMAAFEELVRAAWTRRQIGSLEIQWLAAQSADPSVATLAEIDRLSRYSAPAEMSFARALRELRALQTERALRAPGRPVGCLADMACIARHLKMTKRSQITLVPVAPD